MYVKKWIILIKEVVNEFLTDNCPHLAAAISYYLLFSLFPLVLALISALGFILRSPEMEARVLDGIGNFLPVSSDFVTNTIRGVVSARGVTGALATIGLIWAGSSVFNAIRKSLNTAWGIKKPRPFFVERALELGMMIGASLLLLLSLALTTALKVIRELSLPVLGEMFLDGNLMWNFITMILGTILAFMVFLFLYRVIPNTKVRWRDVWFGALLAAVAFEIAKNIFVWYVTNFSHYNLVYGPVGTIIALLLWTYVSAVIMLFCAKFTSAYPKLMASLEVQLKEEERGHIPSSVKFFLSKAQLKENGVNIIKKLAARKD
jgi:membrane protein